MPVANTGPYYADPCTGLIIPDRNFWAVTGAPLHNNVFIR